MLGIGQLAVISFAALTLTQGADGARIDKAYSGRKSITPEGLLGSFPVRFVTAHIAALYHVMLGIPPVMPASRAIAHRG